MSNPIFGRWLVLIGALTAVCGITLYSQLGRIVDLRVGLAVLNTAVILSFSTTALGLLGTLIGSVSWARRAPLVQVLISGASGGLATVLLAEFVDINVHGPTAILLFVMFAGALGSVVILFIAAFRFVQRNLSK